MASNNNVRLGNQHSPRALFLCLLAAIVSALAAVGCTQEPPPPPAPPEPERELFHWTRPVLLDVASTDTSTETHDLAWLERELRYLLLRGHMRLLSDASRTPVFVLRLQLDADAKHAQLQLIAPDGLLERERKLELGPEPLATIKTLAEALPRFLETPARTRDWTRFIGTDDARAYDIYLRSAQDVLGASSPGITRPVWSNAATRAIARLESLTRSHPRFARAWAALAVAYLSLGGKDVPSLTELAESSAERALVLDDEIAEAHAALGIVHLRRNEWIAAHERLQRALELDARLAAAAEAIACLYADAGLYARSLAHSRLAVSLQPRNAGALECLAYAEIGSGTAADADEFVPIASVARVRALAAFLQGDARAAERLLRRTIPRAEFEIWAGPTLQATSNRRMVPDALKAITRAANDGYIDAATEILCGAALKQPEFVFNRIARLARDELHAPLRVLWLPNADFLRKHPRFEDVISKAGLPSFWHGNGPPDICVREPNVYGCSLSAAPPTAAHTGA